MTRSIRVSADHSLLGYRAAVLCQVAWSVPRYRLVGKGGDPELAALPHWKPVQLVESWRGQHTSRVYSCAVVLCKPVAHIYSSTVGNSYIRCLLDDGGVRMDKKLDI